MRIFILGVTGFIGSAICSRLSSDGHSIIGASRASQGADSPNVRYVSVDLGTTTSDQWEKLLRGVDAVVNCAGILQDEPDDSTTVVHDEGVKRLVAACAHAGVRRIVHFSAIGVDDELSDFSKSKRAGDEAIMRSSLDWFILRPSVVIGRAAYGGGALLRGLAALPVLPIMKGTGPLQLVYLDDVVQTVDICLRPETPARRVLELAGPKRWSLEEAARLFRRWMRWAPAPSVTLPQWATKAMFKAGDLVGKLGWRAPIRSNAQREMARGAVGDPAEWRRVTAIEARDVETALMSEPASVQERWFARLYFIKPIVFGVFSLFWISTAIVSLGPGWDIGVGLMHEGGVTGIWAPLTVIAGASADLVTGALIAWRRTSRIGLYVALALCFSYAILGTILVPRLWRDPLGPMLKIWPIVAFNLVAIAIRDDR